MAHQSVLLLSDCAYFESSLSVARLSWGIRFLPPRVRSLSYRVLSLPIMICTYRCTECVCTPQCVKTTHPIHVEYFLHNTFGNLMCPPPHPLSGGIFIWSYPLPLEVLSSVPLGAGSPPPMLHTSTTPLVGALCFYRSL